MIFSLFVGSLNYYHCLTFSTLGAESADELKIVSSQAIYFTCGRMLLSLGCTTSKIDVENYEIYHFSCLIHETSLQRNGVWAR